MAAHVKSIDDHHMLEIGLEGFYGNSGKQNNPHNYLLGTDFISNNQIPEIDFATIHLYDEVWYGLYSCLSLTQNTKTFFLHL